MGCLFDMVANSLRDWCKGALIEIGGLPIKDGGFSHKKRWFSSWIFPLKMVDMVDFPVRELLVFTMIYLWKKWWNFHFELWEWLPGRVSQIWWNGEGMNNISPLVMTNIAIENGHRNSEFSHEKWWFSIVMLVYQRVALWSDHQSRCS